MNRSNKPILLVEDDHVDAMMVKRAVRDLHILNPLEIVGNGLEALDYLRNGSNAKPLFILLDLNMPKMNGVEFLKIVKGDAALRTIPVVVLTTSAADQDRMDSFNLSVAGYMIKPVEYIKFLETMRVIQMYWSLCELP